MQALCLTITPPALRCLNASVGQAATHGAGLHATHTWAAKPALRPPAERILMPARCQERLLCMSLAQASEHE
jgi:hypothetical protein